MRRIAIMIMICFLLTLLALPVIAENAPAKKVSALCASTQIPYPRTFNTATPPAELDSLTKRCADAGLPNNPYPVPSTAYYWYTPDDNTYHRHDASAYLIITDLNIGGTHYTGVSCNTFDGFRNIGEGILQNHYNAIWYIGDLGDMDSGFKGNLELLMTGYLTDDPDWFSVHGVMQGFGTFEGYTLIWSYDAVKNGVWTGTCIIR